MRVKLSLVGAAMGFVLFSLVGCGNQGDTSGGNNASPSNQPSNNNSSSANNTASANNSAPVASSSNPAANTPSSENSGPVDPEHSQLGVSPNHQAQTQKNPQQKMATVSPAGSDGWSKTELQAKEVASRVDQNIKALRNSKLHFDIEGVLPEGRGFARVDAVVADDKRYLLQYAKFIRQDHPHWETYIVAKVPSGGYGTLVGQEYHPGRIEPDANVLTGWATDMSQYMVSGIGTKKMPFTDLITAAQKAKWKITVEDKRFETGHFTRILLESPDKPERRYETIIEPNKMLPVSFSATINAAKPTQVTANIMTLQSSKPLTDADLKPKVSTSKMKPSDVTGPTSDNKVFVDPKKS